MKVLTKNSVYSVLKVGFVTSLLASFMLMGVDLFKNLDMYTSYQLSGFNIFFLTILYFPSAFLLALGPAFLFAVTYYLSMLHASNEMICILNSGVNYKVFLIPILICAVFVSGFYFVFDEFVALKLNNLKEAKIQIYTYSNDGTNDNANVVISDYEKNIMVYAQNYVDSEQTLYHLTLLEKDEHGSLKFRINAYLGKWSNEDKCWVLTDVLVYSPDKNGIDVKVEHLDSLKKTNFTLEPELFRNLSGDISKMSLPLAINYLNKIKNYNATQYASMATDFYKRVLSCLTPLVMMVIACSLNYRFKKNVLFFSILYSICIAVVYYVVQMVTLMLADQGVIMPWMGMIIPFITIILLTAIQYWSLKD